MRLAIAVLLAIVASPALAQLAPSDDEIADLREVCARHMTWPAQQRFVRPDGSVAVVTGAPTAFEGDFARPCKSIVAEHARRRISPAPRPIKQEASDPAARRAADLAATQDTAARLGRGK